MKLVRNNDIEKFALEVVDKISKDPEMIKFREELSSREERINHLLDESKNVLDRAEKTAKFWILVAALTLAGMLVRLILS